MSQLVIRLIIAAYTPYFSSAATSRPCKLVTCLDEEQMGLSVNRISQPNACARKKRAPWEAAAAVGVVIVPGPSAERNAAVGMIPKQSPYTT